MQNNREDGYKLYNGSEPYPEWRARLVQGLAATQGTPRDDIIWRPLAHIPPGTPGARDGYGETWYQGETDGQTLYKCATAHDDTVYSPPGIVRAWLDRDFAAMSCRLGPAHAAQIMLECIALYRRRIECYAELLPPLEFRLSEYIDLARQSDWYISGAHADRDDRADCIMTAQQFNIPYVVLRHIAWGDDESVRDSLPPAHDVRAVYIHPESSEIFIQKRGGRWFGTADLLAQDRQMRAVQTAERPLNNNTPQ